MHDMRGLIKSELSRTVTYISEHPLFKEEYRFNFLCLKIGKVNHSEEYRRSSIDFLTLYFDYLGEMFYFIESGSRESGRMKSLKEDLLSALITFNNFNDEHHKFEIPDALKDEIIVKSAIKNDEMKFLLFLTSRQIGCVNRAILLRKDTERKLYCVPSLALLKDTTLDLIDFICDQSWSEICTHYESFYRERYALINSEQRLKKLPKLVNGFYNFYDIYGVIRRNCPSKKQQA